MENKDIDLIIHKNRIDELVSMQIGSSFISYAGSIILFYIFRFHSSDLTWLWILVNTLVFSSRIILITYYKKVLSHKKLSKKQIKKYERTYAFVQLIAGLTWGSCIHVYVDVAQKDLLVLLSLFPVGAVTGGGLKLLLSPFNMICYVGGVLVSFSSHFLLGFSVIGFGLVFGAVILLLSLIITSRKHYYNFLNIQRSSFEKEKSLEVLKQKLVLEKELKHQKVINAQSSRLASLGEMAGGIAHEINSPLTIIKLNLESLKKSIERNKELEDRGLGMIETASLTVDRIAKIIKGLLLFSREQDITSKEIVSIGDILNESLTLSSEKFRIKKIELKLNINKIIEVNVNKISITQVIINLLNNSYYYIKDMENPWIEITSKEINNSVVLTFIDSGKPIPQENQNKLFDPFFTSKPIGDGTGLGLSVSKGIIEANAGELIFEDGIHPCFIIKLPIS